MAAAGRVDVVMTRVYTIMKKSGINRMNVFLFLNGGIENCFFYKEHISSHRKEGDRVICADGGYYLARKSGVVPDQVVGDFDSLDEGDVDEGIETVRFPEEKDFSDFELALGFAVERKPARIYVYGALGGRVDHELINILLLYRAPVPLVFMECGMEVYNVRGRLVLVGRAGCTCSLVSLEKGCRIRSLEGFRYKLENEVLRPSSRGLSNVIKDDRAEITVSRGRLLVMVNTKT